MKEKRNWKLMTLFDGTIVKTLKSQVVCHSFRKKITEKTDNYFYQKGNLIS